MKNLYRISTVTASAALAAMLMLAPLPGLGQSEQEKAKARAAAKSKAIAQALENNSLILNVYDRQGKVVGTVGERGLFGGPVWSPDRTRVALIKPDLEKETSDLWVLDVATGAGTRVTNSTQAREFINAPPVWSPDGRQIAYVALRGGSFNVYRKASNGEGAEELVYQHPGILNLADWTQDGRYLGFFTTDLGGGTIYALPLTGDRKPIEIHKSKFQIIGPRFSPDSRYYVYASNETGRNEDFVRAFDPAAGASAGGGKQWQISDEGGGPVWWRREGKQLYLLGPDRGFREIAVNTTGTFEAGKPRVIFNLGEAIPVGPGNVSMSLDGERFVIAVPTKPRLRQLTVFDREGKVLNKVGEPGLLVQPHISPDGKRLVAMRNDPKTGQNDIWTWDIASGKSYAVTASIDPENAPIWSPDGKQVAYVSTPPSGLASIYRKAWDGSGNAERVFTYTPGAGMVLTDWSQDGKFMTFYTGVLVVVPLGGDLQPNDRKAIDWLREEYNVLHGRFSPDMRYIAYLSDQGENGKLELYVRPFDAAKPNAPPPGPVVQVSKDTVGNVVWRGDGKEMYFLQPDPQNTDVHIMSVDVSTTPAFTAGTPRPLFKLKGPLTGNSVQWKSVSADGQRFVFAIDVPQDVPAR